MIRTDRLKRPTVVRWLRLVPPVGVLLASSSVLATSPDLSFLAADVNQDGSVDVLDFGLISGYFGDTEHDAFCTDGSHLSALDGDFDHDGDVDVFDIATFYAEFGETEENDLPAIPTITGVNIDVTTFDPDTFDFVAKEGSTTLMDNSGSVPNLWTAHGSSLEPDMTVETRDDGFDIDVVYDYSSGDPETDPTLNYGYLYLSGIKFATTMYVMQFGGGVAEEREVVLGQSQSNGTYAPGGKYAPLIAMRGTINGTEYVIGVAVEYAVLEYRHGLSMLVNGGNPCKLQIALNSSGSSDLDMQPGETHTYKIVVRFMKTADWDDPPQGESSEWDYANRKIDPDFLRLFRDYRRYFKKLYGDVQYTKDPRPVHQVVVAGGGNCTQDDFGFIRADTETSSNPVGKRLSDPYDDPPDPNTYYGWLAWIHYQLQPNEDNGFTRQMIWCPGGYACDSSYNYPFQFTSHWDCIAQGDTGHPIFDTLDDLNDWINDPNENRAIGFWWGRCVTPRYGWEPEVEQVFPLDQCDDAPADPDDVDSWDHTNGVCQDPDPEVVSHVALAFHELDGADDAGVSEIGLDDSREIPTADLYTWIRTMRDNYPQFRFITEPTAPDFINTIAPNFVRVVGDGQIDLRSSLLMAEFLNQGEETWGWFKHNEDYPEDWETTEGLQDAMVEYAGYGFCCVISRGTSPGNLNDPENSSYSLEDFNAADIYTSAIPSDLQ